MYVQEFGTDIKIAKCFSVYGKGQKIEGVRKVIPTFIMNALLNQSLEIYGSGDQKVDLIHVEDTAEALSRLGEFENLEKGEKVEIGSGEHITINSLAEMVIELAGSRSGIVHVPMREGETPESLVVADTTKMYRLLNFYPHVDLEDGLKDAIEWYRATYLGQRPFVSLVS